MCAGKQGGSGSHVTVGRLIGGVEYGRPLAIGWQGTLGVNWQRAQCFDEHTRTITQARPCCAAPVVCVNNVLLWQHRASGPSSYWCICIDTNVCSKGSLPLCSVRQAATKAAQRVCMWSARHHITAMLLQDAYQSPLTFSGSSHDALLLTLLEAVYSSPQDRLVASVEQALPLQPSWLNFNRVRLRAERSMQLLPHLSARMCFKGMIPLDLPPC